MGRVDADKQTVRRMRGEGVASTSELERGYWFSLIRLLTDGPSASQRVNLVRRCNTASMQGVFSGADATGHRSHCRQPCADSILAGNCALRDLSMPKMITMALLNSPVKSIVNKIVNNKQAPFSY